MSRTIGGASIVTVKGSAGKELKKRRKDTNERQVSTEAPAEASPGSAA